MDYRDIGRRLGGKLPWPQAAADSEENGEHVTVGIPRRRMAGSPLDNLPSILRFLGGWMVAATAIALWVILISWVGQMLAENHAPLLAGFYAWLWLMAVGCAVVGVRLLVARDRSDGR